MNFKKDSNSSNIQTKNSYVEQTTEKIMPVVDMLYEQNSIDQQSITHQMNGNVKTVDSFRK